jgi:translation initiation factor RLI1
MNAITVCGFKFKLAGEFFKNEVASKPYKWNNESKPITTCLKFVEQSLDAITETAYLVTVNGLVVYVGEFSKTLRDRWLMSENYIWHNKDVKIFEAISFGHKVNLYLLDEPERNLSCGTKLNIAKSVEHHILKSAHGLKEEAGSDLVLSWNQRNIAKQGIKVS